MICSHHGMALETSRSASVYYVMEKLKNLYDDYERQCFKLAIKLPSPESDKIKKGIISFWPTQFRIAKTNDIVLILSKMSYLRFLIWLFFIPIVERTHFYNLTIQSLGGLKCIKNK